MTTRCLLLALMATLVWGPAVAQERKTDDAERAKQLIERLRSSKYKDRKQATEALIKLGDAAVPALEAAANDPSPEVRWRVRLALRHITPKKSFFDALRMIDSGKLKEAIAKIEGVIDLLPAKPVIYPNPRWTLGILKEVNGLPEGGAANLSRCISYHNLFCLLREAKAPAKKVLATTRKEYGRLPGNKRARRLCAYVDWEAGDKEAARKSWEAGKPGEKDVSFWTDYDVAGWYAVQGKVKEALARLASAIKKNPRARSEAREASDFYMLRNHPGFKKLLADPTEADAKKPVEAPKIRIR